MTTTTPIARPPASARPGRRSAAFTLVEILMVVMILGITAAVVVPEISTRNDLKAAGAARILMADLTYAQNRAIALQVDHYIVFDLGNNRYTLYAGAATPPSVIANPVSKSNYVTQLGASGPSALQSVALFSATFDGKTILKFDSLGQPYAVSSAWVASALSAQGQVKLKAGSTTMTLTIEPYTGEINVQ